MDVNNQVFNGNVLKILQSFPSDCVDTVVTSPPYYSHRFYGNDTNAIWDENINCEHDFEYTKGINMKLLKLNSNKADVSADGEYAPEVYQGVCKKCGAWYGQLGQEPTPSLFINHLTQVFNEVKRVLKPTGVMFLNMGDTYCGSHCGFGVKIPNPRSRQSPTNGYFASSVMKPPSLTCIGKEAYLKPKQLLLIPSRLAISLQDDGWILRQDIIWKKLSGLPSTAMDRYDNKYEHIFMFVKDGHYYFDDSLARRPYAKSSVQRKLYKQSLFGKKGIKGECPKCDAEATFTGTNSHGALKNDIWELNTSNSHTKHFASYSSELVEECVKPSCPREVCSMCGTPKLKKRKIVTCNIEDLTDTDKVIWDKIEQSDKDALLKKKLQSRLLRRKTSVGFVKICKCKDVVFNPGLVLDPFAGTGTTLLTAKKLGFNYVGVEMHKEYYDIIVNGFKEMLA